MIRPLNANLIAILAIATTAACAGEPRRRPPGDDNGTRDAGTSNRHDAGSDPRTDPTLTEYGRGEHAIFLSEANPRRYCYFIEETVRICGGNGSPTRDDFFSHICIDDETNCLARQPQDSETDNGTCWTRITYDNVGRDALYGDCDRLERYRRDDPSTQCMYHAHCPTNQLCVDHLCVCPPGADCACFDCPPVQPPRCEGDELVSQRYGEGCDENGACFTVEDRIDCASTGGRCNPATLRCEGGMQVDAGSGGGAVDAGAEDAGCQCPPQAPPTCQGNTSVVQTCDPVDCSTGTTMTDCAANGEVCDPSSGQCIEDVECRVASDCPPPGATPAGTCAEVMCLDNMCVETTFPC